MCQACQTPDDFELLHGHKCNEDCSDNCDVCNIHLCEEMDNYNILKHKYGNIVLCEECAPNYKEKWTYV